MPTVETGKTGKRGEQLAADYLYRQGYNILSCNYRWNRGEIDIIAQKNHTIVFVEVKTARSLDFGYPETWVDDKKQKQIGMVAEHFMDDLSQADIDCRFDVIAITLNCRQPKIKHVEDAFWL